MRFIAWDVTLRDDVWGLVYTSSWDGVCLQQTADLQAHTHVAFAAHCELAALLQFDGGSFPAPPRAETKTRVNWLKTQRGDSRYERRMLEIWENTRRVYTFTRWKPSRSCSCSLLYHVNEVNVVWHEFICLYLSHFIPAVSLAKPSKALPPPYCSMPVWFSNL